MDYLRSLFSNQPNTKPSPELHVSTKPLIQPKTSNESVRSQDRLSIPTSEPRSSDDRPPFVPESDDQTSLKMTSSRRSTGSDPSCEDVAEESPRSPFTSENYGLFRSYTDPSTVVPLEIRLRRASKTSKESSRRGSLLPFMVQGAHPRNSEEEDQDALRKSMSAGPTTTLTTIAVIAAESRPNSRRRRRASETYEVIWEGYYQNKASPREEVVPNPPNTKTHSSSLRSSTEDDRECEMPTPFLAAQQLSKEQSLLPDLWTRRRSGSGIGASAHRRRPDFNTAEGRRLSNLGNDTESMLSHTDSITLAKERIAHDRGKKPSRRHKAAPVPPAVHNETDEPHPQGGILLDSSKTRLGPHFTIASDRRVHVLIDDTPDEGFSDR